MLHCYIHNPSRPIRKIPHIPITAAGFVSYQQSRKLQEKIYSSNPTYTALWSSTNLDILQPLFSISEKKTVKTITFTFISQYNEITNVRFSHDGFRLKCSDGINTHYYHHTYLSLSPAIRYQADPADLCTLYTLRSYLSVCFIASISCSYNLMSL